jgi:osomolarity two-component system sensor histidine kinase NIK1
MSAQDLALVLIPILESTTFSPVTPTTDVKFDILYAEDNFVNQKLAVKIILKYGHTVEIVDDGSLAVDAFKARVGQNRPFDIILVRMASLCSCVPEVNRLLYPTRRR